MSIFSTLFQTLVATFALASAQPSLSAVLLTSTDITFSASGTPNSIAGTWSAPSLDLQANQPVEYFSLEILEVQSSFGVPVSLTFVSYFPGDSRSLEFGQGCPVGISCVGLPTVGAISAVDVDTTNQPFARDFLFRLDPDDSKYTSGGASYVSYSGGGSYATASGTVRVNAFGTAAPIPEPEAFSMFLAGLGLIGFMARRRKMPFDEPH